MMTNQVNQEFEAKFPSVKKELAWTGKYYVPKTPDGEFKLADKVNGMFEAWQAATQSRESEINSLKQRVDELQADNERLRELCAKIYADLQMGKACRDTMENLRSAISSTPTHSLAEHDNQIIQMCANEFNVDSMTYKTIQALKATP